jgi:histidinol phosphatase-like enzyme
MKMNNIILLDLDGVLIVHAPWRRAEFEDDGYNKFNKTCVENLNCILNATGYDIVLISARRTQVSIEQMNTYFKSRGVNKEIMAYVPDYNSDESKPWKTRREEVELFLEEYNPENYIIIDDDKSLFDAKAEIKERWIQTNLMTGLQHNKLVFAQ